MWSTPNFSLVALFLQADPVVKAVSFCWSRRAWASGLLCRQGGPFRPAAAGSPRAGHGFPQPIAWPQQRRLSSGRAAGGPSRARKRATNPGPTGGTMGPGPECRVHHRGGALGLALAQLPARPWQRPGSHLGSAGCSWSVATAVPCPRAMFAGRRSLPANMSNCPATGRLCVGCAR